MCWLLGHCTYIPSLWITFGTVNKHHLAQKCFCECAIIFFIPIGLTIPPEDELVGSFSSHLVAAVGWQLAKQGQKVGNPGRVYDPK